MKRTLVSRSLLLATLFLVLAPTLLASTKWYVDGVNGNDANNCKSPGHACKTIGHAISLASSRDSVMVAAATYRENLTIGFSLRIVGSGAATIIDGGGVNTVVTISNAGAHVTLSKLTIRNGLAKDGGGIYNSGTLRVNICILSGNVATSFGGGIYNTGALTVIASTLSGNHAFSGGGIVNGSGGTVAINNSTLSDNGAGVFRCYRCSASGGGITNFGTVTISNSTLSGNHVSIVVCFTCQSDGGGIANGGTVTINNSTLSGNGATGTGGGIYNSSGSAAALQNSIVANSPLGGNCSGTMTSNGYNLSSDGTCNFNGLGDLNNTDPKLGPLQNNGGPTQTQALLRGSPAIDAGNPSGCTDGHGHLLKTDQRGKPRPDKEDSSGCDMGAYERQKD
jgi:hypothetical protein